MKTGAEIIDFKSFNAQNKQSIGDFEKLKSREIDDVVKTSADIFSDEVDEIGNEPLPENEIQPDELVMNGGTHIQKYNSYPYGISTGSNLYNNNGLDRVKKFKDFNY